MESPDEHAAHDAEAKQQITRDVAEFGWHVALLESDGYSPAFAYSIGLHRSYGYPEIICFGLSLDLLHSLLWSAKELLDQQPAPDLSRGYPDFLEGYEVRLLPVDPAWYPDYFGYAKWFYQGWNFPALQIVWPDKLGRLPWQADFNPAWQHQQPLLDRGLTFKFREAENLAVFTTRPVLAGQPILRVTHEPDGDWQFLCDTTYDVADLKIVALSEIVKRDPSVNELFQLNYGWQATRATPAARWQTSETEAAEAGET